MATLAQARAAKNRAKDLLGELPELRGVGIARGEDGFYVKVNLERKPRSRRVPTQIDGVPLRVEVVGQIRPLVAAPKPR